MIDQITELSWDTAEPIFREIFQIIVSNNIEGCILYCILLIGFFLIPLVAIYTGIDIGLNNDNLKKNQPKLYENYKKIRRAKSKSIIVVVVLCLLNLGFQLTKVMDYKSRTEDALISEENGLEMSIELLKEMQVSHYSECQGYHMLGRSKVMKMTGGSRGRVGYTPRKYYLLTLVNEDNVKDIINKYITTGKVDLYIHEEEITSKEYNILKEF